MPPGFAGMSAACLVDAVTGVPGRPSAAAFRPQLRRGFGAGHCWLAPPANSLKVMSPYLASSLLLSGLIVDFDYNEGGNGRQPAKIPQKSKLMINGLKVKADVFAACHSLHFYSW